MKKTVSLFLLFVILFNLFIPAVSAKEYVPSSSLEKGNYETGNNGSVVFDNADCYISKDEFPDTPTLSYSFTANNSSYYYVWINAKATNKVESGDSVWVGADNKDYVNASLSINKDDYTWIRVHTVYLEKGAHTIDFIPREPYLEILKIMIADEITKLPYEELPYEVPSFNPGGLSHPRVLLNDKTIDIVRSNLSHPDNALFLAMHEKALTEEISEEAYNVPGIDAFNLELNTIKSYAFEYVINGNETYGNKAVYFIKNKLEKIKFNSEADYTQAGNLIYATAIVYDWCYPLLTEEDKEYIIDKALQIQSLYSQVGWPPVKLSEFGGHGSESGVLRDLLALGIAVFDENSDIYSVTAGRILDEYVAPRNLYYSSHKSLFGTSYGIYRGKHDITSMLLFKGIGKEDIFDEQISKFPYWYIYGTRGDGHYMDDGDTKINWATTSEDKRYSASYAYLALASLYGDKTLKDAFYKEDAVLTDEYLEALIINDVDLTDESIENLNYSKFFPYPSGSYIARTGWNRDLSENPSAVVTMKINELNLMDHNHQDAGGFQIYYKGNLATDSGYYQTVRDGDMTNDTSGEYYQAYYKQSVAHNVMLVYDENEPVSNFIQGSTGESYNSGGQIMPSKNGTVNYPKTAEELKNDEKFNTSKVLAHEHNENVIDPDYTYLKGDLSNAYSEKVDDYERSFMFLNLKNDKTPGVLIVFDRVVASNLGYKKTYLLHGVNAPVIDKENQRVTLVRNEKNQYGNDYNGKLINDTLLPENANIVQVGENHDDYIINDKNFVTTGKGIKEGGGIRTEISPSTYRKKDYFLNVMQITDADNTDEPLKSTLIKSDSHTGVQIADRVVMFGNEKERLDTDVKFAVVGDGEFKFAVADLKEGKWNVFKNGVFLLSTDVTKDGGVASFVSETGEFTVTRASGINVNISCGEFGSISPSGELIVAPGSEITIEATPHTGYKLKSITSNGIDITIAAKEEKIIVKVTEDTNIYAEFEKIAVNLNFKSPETFYKNFTDKHLGEHKGENAFLVFSKITDIENEGSLTDYGMLVKEGESIPEIYDNATVKSSQFKYNSSFEGQDYRFFGIIFYGKDVKNFSKYSVRPYAVFDIDGTEVVKYGDVCTDYVVNSSDYPVSGYRIDE